MHQAVTRIYWQLVEDSLSIFLLNVANNPVFRAPERGLVSLLPHLYRRRYNHACGYIPHENLLPGYSPAACPPQCNR